MLFYSFGSAVGATGTTAVYSVAGWAGSSLLGAAFAFCALIVWAVNRHAAADARQDVLVQLPHPDPPSPRRQGRRIST